MRQDGMTRSVSFVQDECVCMCVAYLDILKISHVTITLEGSPRKKDKVVTQFSGQKRDRDSLMRNTDQKSRTTSLLLLLNLRIII